MSYYTTQLHKLPLIILYSEQATAVDTKRWLTMGSRCRGARRRLPVVPAAAEGQPVQRAVEDGWAAAGVGTGGGEVRGGEAGPAAVLEP